MQSSATCTQLKPADEPTPIKHQAHLQSRATKKQTDSPKKSKRLSKDHKTEESSADLFSSEVSVEEIRALFKPMAPCISPIADLVRIYCMLKKNILQRVTRVFWNFFLYFMIILQ